MYAKVFSQIYDGTLGGDWKALVTFQQLLVLSDERGHCDMTAAAIHRVTGIPLDIIEHGIDKLSEPDSQSRSPAEAGRRIIPIDSNRNWGWLVVNKSYYRDLASLEDKRRKDRDRIADKRNKEKSQDVASSRGTSQNVADVAHTYTDTNTYTNTTMSGKPDITAPLQDKKIGLQSQARDILQFLNSKTGKRYQPVRVNLDMIMARLKEGATVMQCRQIIARKTRDWLTDEKMAQYLRPATLFNRTKFWQYMGELVPVDEPILP